MLLIDMNDDVRTSELTRELKKLGLRDAILSKHHNLSPPATFDRNNNKIPIDAIFVSQAIRVTRAGYMPFNNLSPSSPSDGHRMLWIEVCNYSILGKDVPHSTKAVVLNGVPSNDPRKRKSLEGS